MTREQILGQVEQIVICERHDDVGGGVYDQLHRELRGELLQWSAANRRGYRTASGGPAKTYATAMATWRAALVDDRPAAGGAR